MAQSNLQTIGLPTTDAGSVDIEQLETETVTYGDVEEGDIIVAPAYAYVGLVVAEPVREVRTTPDGAKTIVHVPVMDYTAQETIRKALPCGKAVRDQKSLELFHDIAINIGHERGEVEDAVEIVTGDSRQTI